MTIGQASIPALRILGVRVHDVDYGETLRLVETMVEAGGPHQICTVNPEFIMRAQRDPSFASVLAQSDLNVPDGVGVLWAARQLGHPLRTRVTGSDLLPLLCERAAARSWRVFFLGAREGVAECCAGILASRFPGLQVAGCHAGSPLASDDAESVRLIQASRPQVLFVAYGAPAQDFWLARNLPAAAASFGFGLAGIGVGGAFDFVAGVQTRAPLWMRDSGLEWLFRLIQEPSRWRRQTVLVGFMLRVLLEFAKNRGRAIC